MNQFTSKTSSFDGGKLVTVQENARNARPRSASSIKKKIHTSVGTISLIREKTKTEMELEALLRIVGELQFHVVKVTTAADKNRDYDGEQVSKQQLAPELKSKFQQLTKKIMDVQCEVDK